MKILFLIYHGLSDNSGVSKKIIGQVNGLRELGHEVFFCYYSVENNGCRVLIINDKIVYNFGKGKKGALLKRIKYNQLAKYAKENDIDLVYARSFHNANPFTISLFKNLKKYNIKSVIEIPTYPYDQEYIGINLNLTTKTEVCIDKVLRNKLASLTNGIVTFTNDEEIFGKKTIKISNGIDFSTIKIKNDSKHEVNEIHLIGVAEVHFWHGYDRLIHGIGEYYNKSHDKDIFFHIVGGIASSEMYGSQHAPGFHELIEKYNIKDKIIFHEQKFGDELDKLFDNADFAIGSLARHRSGISNIKTLKNREYAARGIPFIYSETDNDFENMPYIIKARPDESAINIYEIIKFYESCKIPREEIRKSIMHLSWKEQMNIVINSIANEK